MRKPHLDPPGSSGIHSVNVQLVVLGSLTSSLFVHIRRYVEVK